MPEANGNIPQPASGSKFSPQHGEPYNYSLLLDCVQIPRLVYRDRTLSPGARLMWGAVRRLGFKTGQCFATDARLGEEIGVSESQVRRYSRQLVKAGLMRCTETPGKTTCRELLWHERFSINSTDVTANSTSSPFVPGRSAADSSPQPPRADMTGEGAQICAGGPVTSAHPIISGVLEASLEKKPPPFIPPPETGIEQNSVARGSGGGKPNESAPPNRLKAGGAQRKGRPSVRPPRSPDQQNANRSGVTADERTHEALARILCFHWLRITNVEPPIEIMESIAKVLRARRIDDTAFAFAAQALSARLKAELTPEHWLKLAVEWGQSPTAPPAPEPHG